MTPLHLGRWCSTLSTAGHSHCQHVDCECPCHLPLERGNDEGQAPRPHSYPRLDWAAHKPPGWHEAERLGRPYHRTRGQR